MSQYSIIIINVFVYFWNENIILIIDIIISFCFVWIDVLELLDHSFIAIALHKGVFLDALCYDFSMNNSKSCDQETTHMDKATSKPSLSDVLCLLLFA